MKRKKIYVLLFIFCTMLVIGLTGCKPSENNDTQNPTENEVIEKTDIAQKVEDNFGWLIAVPIGTVLSVLLEFFFLYKSKKNSREDLNKNEAQRKSVTDFITDSKKIQNSIGNYITESQSKFEKLEISIKKLDDDSLNSQQKFNEVIEANKILTAQVNDLLQAISLMAKVDKDLVASGLAEKINNIANRTE